MAEILPRWQRKSIETAMGERRVLLLAGPRQCGKTTLVKHLDRENTEYRTLDDKISRELADVDPFRFIDHGKGMLIIDEVQKSPDLLPVIKMAVDEDTRPGQFLLTGSSNVRELPGVRESLAGRVAKIRLRTLTEGEIRSMGTGFLERAFDQDFRYPWNNYGRDELIEAASRGGYPEAIGLGERARRRWHLDYVEALIERDLGEIARIRNHDAMRELLRTLAAWSSRFVDLSAIGSGMSIQRATLESYVNMLDTLFLVERVPPWSDTDYGRVGKRRKIFMTDSGLIFSLLRWSVDQIRRDSDRSGKLLESFAFSELAPLVDAGGGQYELYHYRDREKREIDFVVTRDDGAMLGIEVKAAATAQRSDFKHLKWFRDRIAGRNPFVGIVLYSGKTAGSFGEGLWLVPFGAMWA